MSNTAYLLDKMRNKWAAFFMEELPEFMHAMQVAPEHCACPVHGGTDGFRLFHDWHATGGGVCNTCGAFGNGIRLLAWARGIPAAKAEARVSEWLGAPGREDAVPDVAACAKVDYEARRRRLEAVWATALPVTEGTPAWRYLQNRGLRALGRDALDPDHVRWHPGLAQVYNERRVQYPTLILRVSLPDGGLASLHRIFLTARGQKAPLPSAKKIMPGTAKLGGSAIRLFPAGPELILAEGAETAWAGHVLSRGRLPSWACVSSTMMQSVMLPEEVRTVHILADLDSNGAGQRAAEKLKARLEVEGRRVLVHIPPLDIPAGGHKVDWLDVLVDNDRNLA